MHDKWFRRSGVIFIPQAIQGWFIVSAFLALAIYLFLAIDRHSHSVSDTLMNFTFNLIPLAAFYVMAGFFLSDGPGKED